MSKRPMRRYVLYKAAGQGYNYYVDAEEMRLGQTGVHFWVDDRVVAVANLDCFDLIEEEPDTDGDKLD